MTVWLFIGNMIFCFATMYFYGKVKYADGFHDGMQVNIEKVIKEE
jgi:hypothetical protein